jgi:hypothetical protein
MTYYNVARQHFLDTVVGSVEPDDEHEFLLTSLVVTEGHINDLQLQWLQANGATSNYHNQAFIEWYEALP